MARRLAFGYAVIATVWCAQAFALGLGDITIHSALNQNLNAEIELLETRGLSESEIIAQLGTAEDFKRVGVERFFFLTSLQFHVEMRDGRAFLRVTTDKPITEPYLNFLVQVVWPNGRLLKEYTVLLDPPTYKEQPAPAVASPRRSDPGGGPAGRVERTPTRPDSQVSFSSAPRSTPSTAPSSAQDRLNGDTYGMTDRDDTLWKIAQRTRPSDGVTVQQNMLAIQRLNPQAFIGNNINLLKAGYKLRLPKADDVEAMSASDAVAEVAAQNQAWQAYRRGESLASRPAPAEPSEGQALAGQVDATAKTVAPPTKPGPDGELRIVAGDAADRGNGTGATNADVAALEGQLVAAKEEADRISRERDEAVEKLGQVTTQAEQTQRQIEVRDQQIAQMQEQLKKAKQAQTQQGAVAASKPEASGIMALLGSPMVLGGAAVVLVLIVVAGLMRARSRRSEDDTLPTFDEPAVRAGGSSTGRSRPRVEEITEEEPEPTLEAPSEPADEHDLLHHEGAQTSDVIGEADIYIAYGRYPQAVSLLLGALEDDPNRSDVRVKLLEVYAETKDETGFEKHMTELLNRCDDEDLLLEARELEAKLREDAPVAASALSATHVDEAAPATVDDFQLDLDADDDVTPPKRSASTSPEPRASDDLGGDLGIDFKAGDEPTVVRPQAPAARAKADLGDVAVATGDDDEFDLEDLEFEPTARAEAKAPRAATAEEGDDAFEFLNEEDAATTKLDLARAYIDMGDEDGAREILTEVLQEGSTDQQQAANELLAKLK
jgi:pilus assembly protein FimV